MTAGGGADGGPNWAETPGMATLPDSHRGETKRAILEIANERPDERVRATWPLTTPRVSLRDGTRGLHGYTTRKPRELVGSLHCFPHVNGGSNGFPDCRQAQHRPEKGASGTRSGGCCRRHLSGSLGHSRGDNEHRLSPHELALLDPSGAVIWRTRPTPCPPAPEAGTARSCTRACNLIRLRSETPRQLAKE
jgi:hypothetical protein